MIRQKLEKFIDDLVETDPARWKEYSLRPLQAVDSMESPFFHGLENAVAKNIDYEISTQNDDGSWSPTWSWGEVYPDDWKKAQRENEHNFSWSHCSAFDVMTFDRL